MEESKKDYDETKMEGYYDGPDCMRKPGMELVFNDYTALKDIINYFKENNLIQKNLPNDLPDFVELNKKAWNKNYKKMMLALHPDKIKGVTEEDLELISQAFSVVQDLNERLKCYFRDDVKLGGKKKSKKHRRKTLGNRRRQTSRR